MAAVAFAQGRIGLIQPELEAADGTSGHLGPPDLARSVRLRRLVGALAEI
jgi:hypothetical protein